jgi:hypothetical protein
VTGLTKRGGARKDKSYATAYCVERGLWLGGGTGTGTGTGDWGTGELSVWVDGLALGKRHVMEARERKQR